MSSDFAVESVPQPDTPHAWELTLRGELDMWGAEIFKAAVDELIAQGARFLVVDLAAVDFFDSSGLTSVLKAAEALEAEQGRLTVTGLSAAAERVLEITGTLQRLRATRTDQHSEQRTSPTS